MCFDIKQWKEANLNHKYLLLTNMNMVVHVTVTQCKAKCLRLLHCNDIYVNVFVVIVGVIWLFVHRGRQAGPG